MRKVERLQQVAERFGPEFVLPYRVCHSWEEIERVVQTLESQGKTWGVRTDLADGWQQGFKLPFELRGTMEKVRAIWDKNGSCLEYIIGENILRVCYHAVAQPLDDEHVFFEWNDREPEISQRDMYEHPDNLKQIVVGPFRRGSAAVLKTGYPFPIFQPTDPLVIDLGFDQVYHLVAGQKIDEVVFTIREKDRKMIIW